MSTFQKFFGGTMGVVVALCLGSCCVVSVPIACVLGTTIAVKNAADKVKAEVEAEKEQEAQP